MNEVVVRTCGALDAAFAANALYRKAGGVLSPTDDAMFTFGKAVCTFGGAAAPLESGS